jgi:hypothetical protein
MVSTIRQIISIKNEAELMQQFAEFEEVLDNDLSLLRGALAKQPLTQEVPKLETHMTYVESWRDRVGRRHALVVCFVEHAKSHHFMLPKGKHITSDDRTAYQKSLTAGMVALQKDLEELIVSIDSRVNGVKKLIGIESDIGGRRLHA